MEVAAEVSWVVANNIKCVVEGSCTGYAECSVDSGCTVDVKWSGYNYIISVIYNVA